ncbi:MAG TPA: sugar phosphate isomerase/epimerase family protein [bacterium]|nr:sugar phosphate isomerase/epimerase family protein [bacterium]
MKYGICNEIFKDWKHEEMFAFISGLGYTGLEIAPFTLGNSVDTISAKTKDEIRNLASRYGVSIIGNHWLLAKPEGLSLSSPDTGTRKKTSDYLCSLAQFTADIGGELMVLGSPKQRSIGEGQKKEDVRRYVKEGIAPALEICMKSNINICLEPLTINETNFINTADEAIDLIEEISHPCLKLHLDVKAMSAESETIPSIIKKSKKYLGHFHVNDANRRHPGSGSIDYGPIIHALKGIGYKRWLSLEVFDFSPGAETIARESIEYLKKFV